MPLGRLRHASGAPPARSFCSIASVIISAIVSLVTRPTNLPVASVTATVAAEFCCISLSACFKVARQPTVEPVMQSWRQPHAHPAPPVSQTEGCWHDRGCRRNFRCRRPQETSAARFAKGRLQPYRCECQAAREKCCDADRAVRGGRAARAVTARPARLNPCVVIGPSRIRLCDRGSRPPVEARRHTFD